MARLEAIPLEILPLEVLPLVESGRACPCLAKKRQSPWLKSMKETTYSLVDDARPREQGACLCLGSMKKTTDSLVDAASGRS